MEQEISKGLCQCGCGRPAPIARRASLGERPTKRFIHGHNQRVQTTTNKVFPLGNGTSLLLLERESGEIAFTRIDDADLSVVQKLRWSLLRAKSSLYAYCYKERVLLHDFLLSIKGVDHHNGNGLDNRRQNLRSANHFQNMRNVGKHKNNTSGFKGVSLNGKKWGVRITAPSGQYLHLGQFTDKLEAARAYDTAARELHGQFARLNFPEAGEQAA